MQITGDVLTTERCDSHSEALIIRFPGGVYDCSTTSLLAHNNFLVGHVYWLLSLQCSRVGIRPTWAPSLIF